MSKPNYQLIRDLEHECGIGLPHGPECPACRPAGWTESDLQYPSQDRWTEMVNERYG